MNISSLIVIITSLLISYGTASKILFLAPFPGPSHWMMLKIYIHELVNRGHEVTAITGLKLNENLPNYTEILIDPKYEFSKDFAGKAIYSVDYNSDFNNMNLYWSLGIASSRIGLESNSVRKFTQRTDLKFDLIISEQFFQESWLMFAYKFNAPIVTISTYGHSDFMDRTMGLLTPWSHVPHSLKNNWGDNMNFLQRSYNTFISLYDMLYREIHYMPAQNKIAQEFFGPILKKPLPSVWELEKSIALTLINSHRILVRPRPMMPGLINIAGAHIKPPKPLPADLKQFMDSSKDGVIFFSLGSFIRSSDMPSEKVKIFLDAFSQLKQNVLWKWEDDNISNLPSNVRVSKWFPQCDILAHPNVVLFITHGGLFGTTESIHYGIPMLFFPFFADQFRNSENSKNAGTSLVLEFGKLDTEELLRNIKELVDDHKYRDRAQNISKVFRDNLVSPMEESLFWIEYVIRHSGAIHLKSNAVNMSWFSYLLMDVYLLYAAVVFIVFMTVKCIFSRIFGGNGRKVKTN